MLPLGTVRSYYHFSRKVHS